MPLAADDDNAGALGGGQHAGDDAVREDEVAEVVGAELALEAVGGGGVGAGHDAGVEHEHVDGEAFGALPGGDGVGGGADGGEGVEVEEEGAGGEGGVGGGEGGAGGVEGGLGARGEDEEGRGVGGDGGDELVAEAVGGDAGGKDGFAADGGGEVRGDFGAGGVVVVGRRHGGQEVNGEGAGQLVSGWSLCRAGIIDALTVSDLYTKRERLSRTEMARL